MAPKGKNGTEVQTEAPPRHPREAPRVMIDPSNALSYSWMLPYSMRFMQEVESSCVNFELDGQIKPIAWPERAEL
jgi:hypothetical protein